VLGQTCTQNAQGADAIYRLRTREMAESRVIKEIPMAIYSFSIWVISYITL